MTVAPRSLLGAAVPARCCVLQQATDMDLHVPSPACSPRGRVLLTQLPSRACAR